MSSERDSNSDLCGPRLPVSGPSPWRTILGIRSTGCLKSESTVTSLGKALDGSSIRYGRRRLKHRYGRRRLI